MPNAKIAQWPTPWSLEPNARRNFIDANGKYIGSCFVDDASALVVEAVNNWNGNAERAVAVARAEIGIRRAETEGKEMTNETSPRPWHVVDPNYEDAGVDIIDAEGARVCRDVISADAALIVDAANNVDSWRDAYIKARTERNAFFA